MSRTLLTIAGVVAGLWLLNLLTGLFAYNVTVAKHEQAASLIEGIARAGELRRRVDQFFRQNGHFPGSNRELGIGEPDTYRQGIVKSAAIDPDGRVRIDYSGALDGASVVLRPAINMSGTGPAVRWDCFAVGFDESIAALTREPRCATVASLDALPVPPEPEATVDNLVNAIHARRASLVRHLIAAGVNVNGVSQRREAPLIAAVEAGDSTILELLLKAGADVNRKPQENGPTPLMIAARSGCKINAIRILTDAGAEMEARDAQGMTALMHAAKAGDLNCVNALLRAGADVDATDNAGNKAINHAAGYGRSSGVYSALRGHEIKKRQGGEFVYRLPDEN